MDDRELIATYLMCKKELINRAREKCKGHLLNQLAPDYHYELGMFELWLGQFIYEGEDCVEIGGVEYTLEV